MKNKKRTLGIAFAALSLSFLTVLGAGAQTLTEAGEAFRRYDVNEDGRVTIGDVTAILDYLATGCSHQGEVLQGKEKNCFEDGLTDGLVCSSCGEILQQQERIPAGHEYNDKGICIFCGMADTSELDEQGFSYTLAPDGSYYILSSVGRNKDRVVTVPEKYNGLPVAAIGIGAFYKCTYITEIVLPESIAGIGSLAFYGCEALEAINLPNSVLYIGYSAFENCRALSFVTLPAAITEIQAAAFKNCQGLEEIVIPDFVEKVGVAAFSGCTGLKSVKLGVGVKTLEKQAFYGCDALEGVYIKDLAGYCEIAFGDYSANPLYYAKALYLNGEKIKALEIPVGVSAIRENAFRNADFTSVTLPEGLESIGASAFAGCAALETLSLPEELLRIEHSAFSMCTSLTKVTLPDGLGSLGAYAFYNCFSLKTVYLPLELLRIEEYTFAGCQNLSRLYLPERLTYIEDAAFLNCKMLKKIDLPEGVKTIGKDAFHGCVSIKSVSFYDGISSVGSSAFFSCVSLEEFEAESLAGFCEIEFSSADANPLYYAKKFYADGKEQMTLEIPYGVESIGSYAFCGFATEELTLPKGLLKIGEHAFENCKNVKSIVLPKGLVSVGAYAFANCDALLAVDFPLGMATIGEGAFANCDSLKAVLLPEGLSVLLSKTFQNCAALETAVLPSGMRSIGEEAFDGCVLLSTVTLPRALSSIEKNAFRNCKALTNVALPEGLLTVGEEAFFGCEGLLRVEISDLSAYSEINFESVYANPLYYGKNLYLNGTKVTALQLPEGCYRIGDYTFYGYASLLSLKLPASLRSIGKGAFMNCTSIASVTLQENVSFIGSHAFYGCTALQKVRLPAKLTELSGHVFEGCTRLSDIVLPKNLERIGNFAFKDCENMLLSELPEGLVSIGDGAFAGCNVKAKLRMPSAHFVGEGVFAGCTGLADLYCPFEKLPLLWEEDFHGSGAMVHLLPYWSYENGTFVTHTPVIDKGKAPTCTEDGLSGGIYCSTCGKVFVLQETLPALGGSHLYEDGICSRCGAVLPYTWTLEGGILTVSGTGALLEDSIEKYPWHDRRSEILEIVVTGDITEIGAFAFSGCAHVKKITLGGKVTVIGADAFSYNSALEELVFENKIMSLGQGTVYLCASLEKVTLTEQTKSAFLELAAKHAYNDAFESVALWIAEKEFAGEMPLVQKGDDWEYLVFEENPSAGLLSSAPVGWLNKTDSATWSSGNAPFSGGSFGPLNFSAYLRTTFTVENANAMKELTMAVIYDENPSIYLNGQLIWSAEGYHDSGYITVDLSDKLSFLKEGENILCVTFSNVYGGSIFDMELICSDKERVVDGDGMVLFSGASSQGFTAFGGVNDPSNVLDGDPDTVCGSGFDAGVEQSVTITFKGTVSVNSVYVQCKNEGTTSHADGITRGTYDIYLLSGSSMTKINNASVLARTKEDGGATVVLAEGVEATGIKVVITSWDGDCWACLADVMVKAAELQ